MSTIGIDTLKKEHEEAQEWESNAIKRAIQNIIKDHLNNANYRKKSVAEAYAITKEGFVKEGILSEPKYLTTANRLLRKIERCKTISDTVMVLGDYLLS